MNIESQIEFLADPLVGGDNVRVKEAIAKAKLKPQFRVVNVAGTNGKGSVVHGITHMLQRSKLRVGRFISPHVFDFKERIAVDEKPLDNALLLQLLSELKLALPKLKLNYFQWTYLLALRAFQYAEVDIAIFEVGLGGRLDAVNSVDPDIAILTSVNLDHTDILGGTRELIALEKIAIGRPGKPLLCAERKLPEAAMHYAINEKFNLRLIDQHFSHKCKNKIHPDNESLVIEAINEINKILPIHKIKWKGMADLQLVGRQQVLKSICPVLVDVAHNPASVDLLTERVREMKTKGRVHVVFSAQPNKDIEQMIDRIRARVDEWHIAPLETDSTALDRVLEHLARSNTNLYPSVKRAFEGALERCESQDLIVCFGSFRVVADVLRLIARGHKSRSAARA